ncbi:MAG: NAD(P)/FAD-dependent oxidoreductase [Actinomycetales bacterium]
MTDEPIRPGARSATGPPTGSLPGRLAHVAQPGRSLWADTLPTELTAPLGTPLVGDVQVDVAIVGAGYTGLWTAYSLLTADPSLRIAILEANDVGFGASGRNGGWASALFPVSLDALARRSSPAAALGMKQAMQESGHEVGRVARDEGWDIDYHLGGSVFFARTALQWQAAQEELAGLRAWGIGEEDVRLLGAEEARAMAQATDVLGATFTPHCAAIHPLRLARQLGRRVVQLGAALHEGTPVTRIEPGVAHSQHGTVRAEVVVRATEAFTRSLAGQRRVLAPVYSLMIATEPLPAQTWSQIGLQDRPTFSDGRHLIIYGQRTADGRLAFGGRGAPYHWGSRISPKQDVNPSVQLGLAQTLAELFPVTADARITHAWGGPVGIARDWWASVGLDRRTGLAWAGGYVGDGGSPTNLAGRPLADHSLGRQTDLVNLPWVGHRSRRWEPEPLRWLGTNLGLRVVTSADRIEAQTGRPTRRAANFGRALGH